MEIPSSVMNSGLVIATLALSCLPTLTSGLACLPQHPQRNFCSATWAIRGKVLRFRDTPSNIKGDPPLERMYLIDIEKVFKRPDIWSNEWVAGRKAWITTEGNTAAGGVRMTKKKTYLITGTNKEGRAFMTKCNWLQKWSKVNKCHKSALGSGVYQQNCFCPVYTCRGHHCYQQVQHSGCVNENHKQTFDVCVFNKILGSCSWSACGLPEVQQRRNPELNMPNIPYPGMQQPGLSNVMPHANPRMQSQLMPDQSMPGMGHGAQIDTLGFGYGFPPTTPAYDFLQWL